MSTHRRWATVKPIETVPVASPTFNTILDAKKAELSTAVDTSTVTTPAKPKRDITAELAKLSSRKVSSKEKATAPKATTKTAPKKAVAIKPAKTVKAPVATKNADVPTTKAKPVKKAAAPAVVKAKPSKKKA